jgi:hypothetical protein
MTIDVESRADLFRRCDLSEDQEGTVKLTVTFSMTGNTSSAGATARAWIDVNSNGQLTDSEEVLPFTQNGNAWTGSIQSGAANSGGMQFIVKYIASVGTKYQLDVESDTPVAHTVFSAQGTLNTLQGRLIGTLQP